MSNKNPKKNIIDITKFKKIKAISSGGFGIINLVRHKKSNEKLASKNNFPRDGMSLERLNQLISREINIMIRIKHPTIIRFRGYSLKDFSNLDNITIFMDYMAKGSLLSMITKTPEELQALNFNNTNKQIILVGIALGMMMLHSQHVIHRDLKPDNVLLDDNYRPKITDFGLSKFFNPENSKFQSTTNIGTAAYMAPEVIMSNQFNTKADVYSFGILMYEVITGTRAYNDFLYIKKKGTFQLHSLVVNKRFRPEIPKNTNFMLKKLMKMCWTKNPSKRPTFSELFQKLSMSHNFDFFLNEANSVQTLDEQDSIDDFFKFEQNEEKIIETEDEIDDDEFYEDENEEGKSDESLASEMESMNYCMDDVDVEKVFEYLDAVRDEIISQREMKKSVNNQKVNNESDSNLMNNDNKSNNSNNDDDDSNNNTNEVDSDDDNSNNNINEEVDSNNNNENDSNNNNENDSNNNNENDSNNNNENDSNNNNENDSNNNNNNENDPSNNNNQTNTKNNNNNENDSNNNNNAINSNNNNNNENDPNNNNNNENDPNNNNNNENDPNNNNNTINSNNNNENDPNNNNFGINSNNSKENDSNFSNNENDIDNTNDDSNKSNINNNDNENAASNTNNENEIIHDLNNNNENNFNDNNKVNNNDEDEEETDSNENEEEENLDLHDEPSEDTKIITNSDNVRYKLFLNHLVASVFESPTAKGIIFIPQYVKYQSNEYNVISICDKAFANTKIESLSFSFQSSVKKIGNSVFENSSIQKLHLPQSLIHLDNSWCQGALNLNEINVEENNPRFSVENGFLIRKNRLYSSNQILFTPHNFGGDFSIPKKTSRIGNYAFSNHKNIYSLKSSSFSSIKTIDSFSFSNCVNLKNVTFENIRKLNIGDFCFSKCSSLSTVVINGIERIKLGSNSFEECTLIDNVAIKNASFIDIGNNCFFNSTNLKSIAFIADSVILGENFLKKCTSLSFITIDCKNDITILNDTFSDCNLKNVTITTSSKLKLNDMCFSHSKNLEIGIFGGQSISVGEEIFKNCTSLKSISFKNEENIEIDAILFNDCESLETLVLNSNSELKITNQFKNNKLVTVKLTGKTVFVSENSFIDCMSLFEFSILESRNVKLGANQFTNCTNLSKVAIESENGQFQGEVEIDLNCFSGAKNLLEVVFVKGNIKIDNHCFKNCSSLASIKFMQVNNVKFEKDQFINCNSLRTVILNSISMVEISPCSFSGLPALEMFLVTSKDVLIGRSCFRNCPNLSKFEITKTGRLKIEERQFSKCQMLTKIELKIISGQTELTSNCFSEAKNLKKVQFTGGDLIIDSFCFKNCGSIEKVVFKQTNTLKIEKGQFEGCKSLKTVKIEADTSVDLSPECFTCLNALEAVSINSKDVRIGQKSFENCDSLNRFKFEKASNISIGQNAFAGCKRLWNVVFDSELELSVGDGCFIKSGVRTVTLKSQKVAVKNSCFKDCTIQTFSIPLSNEVEIESSAFESCKILENVTVKTLASLKIGERCFYGAKNLRNIQFECIEIFIGAFAFSHCLSLGSFSIPQSNKAILENYAFDCCSKLEDFLIEAQAEVRAGDYCFYKASKLRTITSSAKRAKIGEFCFSNCPALSAIQLISADEILYFENSFDQNNARINFDVKPDVRKIINQSISGSKCSLY